MGLGGNYTLKKARLRGSKIRIIRAIRVRKSQGRNQSCSISSTLSPVALEI